MAGTRLPRRSLIGRAIKYRRRESQLTATCSNFIRTIKYNVIDWNYFLFPMKKTQNIIFALFHVIVSDSEFEGATKSQ